MLPKNDILHYALSSKESHRAERNMPLFERWADLQQIPHSIKDWMRSLKHLHSPGHREGEE